jgi:hypothetical protein
MRRAINPRINEANAIAAFSRRRKSLVGALVLQEREIDLLQIVNTLRTTRRFTRRLHGRQQQRHEDADNGDHDQKFDKRKRRPLSRAYFLVPAEWQSDKHKRTPLRDHGRTLILWVR